MNEPLGSGFGDRLTEVLDSLGRLCVGIDPHSWLLRQWGLPDDARGARDLGLRVVDAASGRCGIVKPQIAFFERHGAAGYAALEEVLAAARAAGLLIIADVKRGDVGSSVEAYGEAWLTPGSPLEADALTLSAYQGVGSLGAPLARARSAGKGVFVLAATSNPEAISTQTAVVARGPHSGRSVAAGIVADVTEWNATGRDGGAPGAGHRSDVGVVIGATIAIDRYGIDASDLLGTPVLAPGFGHQGARLSDIDALFGVAAPLTLASVSRSILESGPDALADAVAHHAAQLAPAARR